MRPLLLVLFSALIFSACCTKKDCVAIGMPVLLVGYESSDVDTIYITRYELGSNFTGPAAEFAIYSASRLNSKDYSLECDAFYTGNSDLVVYIPATQQSFKFSDYTTTTYSCNKCFLKRDREYRLTGCKVNGTYQSEAIRLNK